jgi:hypothetical protein
MPEFWMDKEEQEFLMSFVTPETELLEYGSGSSTVVLQDKVKRMVSVEHHLDWFDKMSPQLKDNVTYLFQPPDNPQWENQYSLVSEDSVRKNTAGDDGTFEDFNSYVMSPRNHGKFDVVFVDGRARVACAWMATFLLKDENSRIFIHDFGPLTKHPHLPYRTYYDIAKNFLEEVDHVKTMYCFKPKV